MTMKLAAADGEILWLVHDGGAARLNDRGWGIVVGPDDHPVVTGIHSTSTDPAFYQTFKLDSADGSEIWNQTLPGAVNFVESDTGWLAVCDNGDIIMVNETWETTTGYDVVLHRYAAADGDTLWLERYNSSGTTSDDPRCMVRDAAGDLLVAGVRSGDFMALKFDEADGGLIWSEDYDGPAGGYDAANAVIEGPNGEVIVTGFSTGAGWSWDVTTVAFEPTDGAYLWEKHFDPGDGRSDEGRALAVSTQGDFYVAGYCDQLATGADMMALRYYLEDLTDVQIGSLTAASTPSILRFDAHPNPFIRRLFLLIDVAREAPARVAVYDVRGRRAALLNDGKLSPGAHRIEWNGRNDSGLPLMAGVYFLRLESAGASAVRKVVLRP